MASAEDTRRCRFVALPPDSAAAARYHAPFSYLEPAITHAQAVGTVLPESSIPTHTAPTTPRSRPSSRGAHTLITTRALHEATTTASRAITSPDDFLNAVRWALRRGFHPRANTTTLRIAEALAEKANRRGHLGYGRNALAADLNLSVACVAAHTRVLRELGLLAWVEHGSKTNVLRTRAPHQQPNAYKATGTIFALVVPPAYDLAHGRGTSGTGYHARLVAVTDRGRRHETRMAKAATRRNATRPTGGRRTPPSCGGLALKQTLQAGENINYTRSRARETTTRHPDPPQRLTPGLARDFIQASEALQAEVSWLSRVCPRRLAFLLRDRFLAGATVPALARELRNATRELVRQPLAYVADHLRRHPTPRITESERADAPSRWIQVPTLAVRPSPIPLRPLVSRRFLDPHVETPASVRHDPVLEQAWEERQVSLAIERTLAYWREQDPVSAHHWGTVEEPDSFGPVDDRDLEWIPVYA
ncbi:hypothetical protein KNE206_57360 [Kitasatospora sp. NE20-6]|uniref:hypothetical protein n=1 Tax=Kitasatospora sp. NE20-6 TaxID=2859066 RepID=UPI0034DC8119